MDLTGAEVRMLVDARQVESGAQFRFDLVIVGAGPAGICLADQLKRAGLSIALIESGGLQPEVAAQQLYRGSVVGWPTWPLHSSRFRVFGGSGQRWGGMSRPLDPIDYARRDWVTDSGWPISYEQVEPYHRPAAELLELSRADFDAAAWSDRITPGLPIDGGEFSNELFQFSPLETRFGDRFADRIFTAGDITTFLHATVTDLPLEPGTDRLGALPIQTLTGRRFSVQGRVVVLATGGLENARLLLAARGDRPTGLGNEHDLVGRFFMDHLHVPAGHIAATAAGADRSFYQLADHEGARLRGAIVSTAQAQTEHQLLAAAIGLEPPVFGCGQPFLNWPPVLTVGPERLYRRLRRGHQLSRQAGAGYKQTVRALWYSARSAELRRAARRARRQAGFEPAAVHALYLRTEQSPNRNSRVSLTGHRDRLGMPQLQLDWQLTDQDTASIDGWLDRLDQVLGERELGRVIRPAEGWQKGIIGGPHHMGTTRMAADPRHGVVDADSRVHSVANLFVAGSSVFSTGGYANPTLTLLALAIRLADRVRSELQHSVTVDP